MENFGNKSRNIRKIIKEFMKNNNLKLYGIKLEEKYNPNYFKLNVDFEGNESNLMGKFHRASEGIIHVKGAMRTNDGEASLILLIDTEAESQTEHPDYKK